MLVDQLVRDPDVVQSEAGQFGKEAVVGRIQAGADDVNELDPSFFLGAGFEQLLFAGANRAELKLPLHNGEPLLNLRLLDARAVASEQKFRHVVRDRILALESAHQVLADQVPIEGRRSDAVQRIEFHVRFLQR